ncbi:hypothetical protein Hanom_Chr05g00469771 [Helianthus anomalus]
MSWYRVPVSNLLNRVYFRYRYSSVFTLKCWCHTSTGIEPYRTRYIRYRYPLLGIWVTVFSVPVGTELIKSCNNVTMQVIAPFRLLFIHLVGKMYFFCFYQNYSYNF